MTINIILFLFFFLLTILVGAAGQDECKVSSYSDNGPAIRFPFKLKGQQPDHCGHPGFELSCNNHHQTVLELPFSVKVLVGKIDYTSQLIQINQDDEKSCLPRQFPNLNLSVSPFHFNHDFDRTDFALFNCSASADRDLPTFLIPCLGVTGYQVYAVHSNSQINDYSLTSCTKIDNIFLSYF
ncbi:putative RING-H2 finger protein ATL21A [Cornus florida]|uniref:putative RING-H2 finger protein ATL21A n=1 Tax=Cornus florida TaxID=4283 RepID=UPI00289C87DA|nr:putative RING-H2 finger protein ATL21A [Cornus florida]